MKQRRRRTAPFPLKWDGYCDRALITARMRWMHGSRWHRESKTSAVLCRLTSSLSVGFAMFVSIYFVHILFFRALNSSVVELPLPSCLAEGNC